MSIIERGRNFMKRAEISLKVVEWILIAVSRPLKELKLNGSTQIAK